MKRTLHRTFFVLILSVLAVFAPTVFAQERVEISNGILEGIHDKDSGLRIFKGIPFAAPPVGDLRWKAPQPVADWKGVRKAVKFGPRAMQLPIYGDMGFRSDGMREDSLYLNVWTPAKSAKDKLPVLVYFYGGGLAAGDGSEGRYDGASMAQKGIVAVTVNYRLGIFGFFAHPALTEESPHKASGNYGFLDQQAALVWVRQNIEVFGGDPERVTIAGESAGSISVSAHMASPLSKDLIAGAIGESGSIVGAPMPAIPLDEAEARGVELASKLGIGKQPSLKALRQMSAEALLKATGEAKAIYFSPTVDGYFLPEDPAEIYAEGKQAHVPLLAGVNSAEMPYGAILGQDEPTVENYRKALQRLYPKHADAIFKLYPASNEAEVMEAARHLASDRFISYGTWTWVDLATRSGDEPTWYYLYTHPRPPMRAELGNAVAGLAGGVIKKGEPKAEQPPPTRGAAHAVEIEYAMGNLDLNQVYAWTPDDYKVSRLMQSYFANFIKTGNPNGKGLPEWPMFSTDQRLVIDVKPRVESTDKLRTRYEYLDRFYLGE